MAHIKQEVGYSSLALPQPNGSSHRIKPEPDGHGTNFSGASPGASHNDEDIYEDAGDLDFSQSHQSLFLTRLPKFLWEAWAQLDDDAEITIGRIRVEQGPVKTATTSIVKSEDSQQGPVPTEIKRMSLMLDASVPSNKPVPKEYNLQITNPNSFNTFIFGEKDLLGYGPGSRKSIGDNGNPPASANMHQMPSHWVQRKRMERRRQQGYQRALGADGTPNRAQQFFRKAVPKQTSLAGQVRREVNCLPVENDEYFSITEQRALMALRPRMRTKVLDDVSSGNLLNPGTMSGGVGDFSTFINKAGPAARRKGQMLKTIRMPQNELLDLIYDCFKEYTYWPLKVLKDRVQQPEQYLRQTLEMVAFQAKSGTHISEWQLKPEARLGTYADSGTFATARDEVAPDVGGLAMEEFDEEDEDGNVVMEDVALG